MARRMRRARRQVMKAQTSAGKKALRISLRRSRKTNRKVTRREARVGELASMRDKQSSGRDIRGDQGRNLQPRGRTDSTPGRNLKETAMQGSTNLQSTYAKSTNAVKPGKGRKKRVKKAPQSELKQNMNTSGLSIKSESAGMNL